MPPADAKVEFGNAGILCDGREDLPGIDYFGLSRRSGFSSHSTSARSCILPTTLQITRGTNPPVRRQRIRSNDEVFNAVSVEF